jgi:SAM-dependent methyltransferase
MLSRRPAFDTLSHLEQRVEDPAAKLACRVARMPGGERERIRAAGPHDEVDHFETLKTSFGRPRYALHGVDEGMRTTWDAAAASDRVEQYVGDPATAKDELDSLFSRLGDDPRGGTCVEVGCGFGRMTGELATRFDRVVALDVSPLMLELARTRVPAGNVLFLPVSGTSLEPVESGSADVLVCYLVLQHLPARDVVVGYLHEFARVLAPGGRAFVQLPVLGRGLRPRAWRIGRALAVPVVARRGSVVAGRPEYRGFRLTGTELERALAGAALRVGARDESPDSPYRYAREVFLRLEREALPD